MPKISVITPVYKVEKYLSKCLDSILNQSFSDFELIVVDDGSPDKCGEIADSYAKKDTRVKVIHKQNGGAPSARNAGMSIATGEYYYFPDSDDWLSPNYLKDLLKNAEKTKAELVISGFTMEYYEKSKHQSFQVSKPEEYFSTQAEVRNNIQNYFNNMMIAVPWNKLYRASYIRKNELKFPSLKWDDLHFNMEVIRKVNSVSICSSVGYHFFRSRPGSETTTVFDGLLYQKRKEQFKHILSVYEEWKIKSPKIMSIIYGYYAARLVQCIQEISISNLDNKKELVSNILNDDLTKIAFKNGKIDSNILSIAALPMRNKNVWGSMLVGKSIGFVKKYMSALFYSLKSKSVNKAN